MINVEEMFGTAYVGRTKRLCVMCNCSGVLNITVGTLLLAVVHVTFF